MPGCDPRRAAGGRAQRAQACRRPRCAPGYGWANAGAEVAVAEAPDDKLLECHQRARMRLDPGFRNRGHDDLRCGHRGNGIDHAEHDADAKRKQTQDPEEETHDQSLRLKPVTACNPPRSAL